MALRTNMWAVFINLIQVEVKQEVAAEVAQILVLIILVWSKIQMGS